MTLVIRMRRRRAYRCLLRLAVLDIQLLLRGHDLQGQEWSWLMLCATLQSTK